jgi:hypothetical protein
MAKLYSFRVACLRVLFVSCFTWPSVALTEVNLDKLTACDDVARLYEFVKEKLPMASSSCLSPRSILEKELARRSGFDTSQLCFHQSAPTSFLEGFSCISLDVKNSAELVCFRSADEADIKLYKEQYKEKYAAAEKKYLSAAAACSASNGDSADAPATILPPLLSLVSRLEFGFITSLGRERPSHSAVVHGYATTDPEISGNAPSALEFVYLIANAPKYSSTSEQKRVGSWLIQIDEDEDFDEYFNQEARRRRMPMMIDSTSYHLERQTEASVSQNAKLVLTEKLQRAIAKSLEDEGFETISGAKLKADTGMDSAEMVEEITKRMPFGTRQKPLIRLGSTLLILSNEQRPKCTQERTGGAMGVYLAVNQPVPEVTSDFGGVMLMIVGLGECARPQLTSTRTYINGLIEESTSQLLATLQTK